MQSAWFCDSGPNISIFPPRNRHELEVHRCRWLPRR